MIKLDTFRTDFAEGYIAKKRTVFEVGITHDLEHEAVERVMILALQDVERVLKAMENLNKYGHNNKKTGNRKTASSR